MMTRKFSLAPFICLSFLWFSGNVTDAQVNIHGCIEGLPSAKVYLAEVYAGRAKLIDTVTVYHDCFDFHESDTLHEGVYYVILNPEKTAFVQLIINGKEVAFHSIYNNLPGNLVIDKSLDNKMLYDYISRTRVLTDNNKPGSEKLADTIIHQYPHSMLSGILRAQ